MIAVFEPLARPQVYGADFECRDGVYQPKPTEARLTRHEHDRRLHGHDAASLRQNVPPAIPEIER